MKTSVGFIVITLFIMLGVSPTFGQDTSNGLVAYWPLDGNAIDQTGLGSNGTIYGAVPAPGKVGQALQFDGVDDQITFAAVSPQLAAVTAGPHSYSVWVFLTRQNPAYPYGAFVVDAAKTGETNPYLDQRGIRFSSHDPAQAMTPAFKWVTTTQSDSLYAAVSFRPYEWHHIAAVYDGTEGRIYVDGVLSGQMGSTGVGAPADIWKIGNVSVGGTGLLFFPGLIDELRIYVRALSDEEVQALATSNNPPTVDAGGPYAVDEGGTVTLTASGTDPEDGVLAYAWDLDNDGTFETPGQSVFFAGVDGPFDSTVSVQVTDDGGLTAVAQTTVHVNNVAPSVNTPQASPEPSVMGSGATITATFSDPGVDDAPFTCTVDYGDNSGALPGTVNGNSCTATAHVYTAIGTYTVTVTVNDKDGGWRSRTASHVVIYSWSGFFQPVDGPPTINSVKAGQAVPVRFSLGGNHGLNIFAAGYPQSVQTACMDGTTDLVEQTVAVSGSQLTYDPVTGQYVYVWKTEKVWAGTCRRLILKLIDGMTYSANFSFR